MQLLDLNSEIIVYNTNRNYQKGLNIILKKFKIMSLVFLFGLLISGCFSIVEQPIPPIKLNSNAIKFHSNNTADLVWKTGTVIPSHGGYSVKVDIYQYGKKSQNSFMQSLQNNLIQAKAYQSVKLSTTTPKLKNKHTIIMINFLKTSVGQTMDCFPIHLTVRVSIQDSKGAFVRQIFVYSKSAGIFSHKSFQAQQIEVSQKLMRKVIHIINQQERLR